MNQDINKVELQGAIGSYRLTNVQNKELLRFCIATNTIYSGDDIYAAVVETTWHSVSYWKRKDDNLDLSKIKTGTRVHVTGRLKSSRLMGNDGIEKSVLEILAHEIKIQEL